MTENCIANIKKILYLSNIEVPYRVRMFNEMAKNCDLTVVYERKKSNNRNNIWTNSERKQYQVEYLGGIQLKNENALSFKILKYVFSKKYDAIIFGCYNSPIQAFAILIMKLFRRPYIINLDGEPFLHEKGFKTKLKRFFLKGAKKYLIAGEKAAESLKKNINSGEIISYGFSSLYEKELQEHADTAKMRKDTILVVGQYFDYKGMDVALQTAQKNRNIPYKFVGMGNRTELFIQEQQFEKDKNIELIPFLQKEDLEREYQTCSALLLPSRQECWGLVINEAASFGTPIISTDGSGAAVEFLSNEYPQYLAKAGDVDSLYSCIQTFKTATNMDEYSKFLLKKSQNYSIEKMVDAHLVACGIERNV